MEGLTDNELWQGTRATLPEVEYEILTQLHERQREGTLTAAGREELDQLMKAADLLTLEKAYAAVLL